MTEEQKGEGWTLLLFSVSISTTIGAAVPIGYCLGVVNTPAEFIKTWCSETLLRQYDLNLSSSQIEVLWASVVSIFLVGGICGSFFGASCCDRLGRKGCLLISAVLWILAGLCFIFCREAGSVEILLLGRWLAGVSAALIFTAHPMYLLEIAPAEIRGSVAVFTAMGLVSGICVAQICTLPDIFGTESLWQYALSCYSLLVIVCFLPSYWLPESPRWLYMVKRDTEAAKRELMRLRGGSRAESRVFSELDEMSLATNAASTDERSNFRSVLQNRELWLPLVLVCSFTAVQQLCGINAIFFYSVDIFTKAGFSLENAAWMNLGAGFLNLAVSLLGPILMAKFNRRPLMMISCLCSGISLLGLAFALFYIDFAKWLPITCIVFLALFLIFFQLGLGPIPFFIGSELFEVSPRSVAMSMGSLFSWLGNFMIGMFFPLLQGVWGSFAFLPCCGLCLYGFLLTWRYLPETRGRDSADLKLLMKDGFKSKVK